MPAVLEANDRLVLHDIGELLDEREPIDFATTHGCGFLFSKMRRIHLMTESAPVEFADDKSQQLKSFQLLKGSNFLLTFPLFLRSHFVSYTFGAGNRFPNIVGIFPMNFAENSFSRRKNAAKSMAALAPRLRLNITGERRMKL